MLEVYNDPCFEMNLRGIPAKTDMFVMGGYGYQLYQFDDQFNVYIFYLPY